MFEYFAVFRVAACSAADPASRATAATYKSANGQMTVTSQVIYGQSSTNPANFVKIRQVDVEMIGLTKIIKNIFLKTTTEHKPSSSGWAKNEIVHFSIQTDKCRKALFVSTVYV